MNDQEERDREFHQYCKETPLPFCARNFLIFIGCFLVSFLITRCFQ